MEEKQEKTGLKWPLISIVGSWLLYFIGLSAPIAIRARYIAKRYFSGRPIHNLRKIDEMVINVHWIVVPLAVLGLLFGHLLILKVQNKTSMPVMLPIVIAALIGQFWLMYYLYDFLCILIHFAAGGPS